MLNQPLISVLLPVYNAEKDLHIAIDSILKQTYDNYELIIIDDGSTDGSMNIVRSFDDARIHFIRQPQNLGLVNSLNRGLSESRGQYIARMDGDDICFPERFSMQISLMKEQQLDICGTHWAQINEYGQRLRTFYGPAQEDEVIATLANTVPYAHGSLMIKKSFIQHHNLRYKLGFSEDYELWIRCFELGAKFGVVNSVLYLHRSHGGSITNTKSREQAISAKNLRRTFVGDNYRACQLALHSLQNRFNTLSKLMQVHTLYMAYRLYMVTGNFQLFLNLFFKTSFLNKLHILVRIIRA
jgi:glycosyltransferase involved in cell wall biosynthesis